MEHRFFLATQREIIVETYNFLKIPKYIKND